MHVIDLKSQDEEDSACTREGPRIKMWIDGWRLNSRFLFFYVHCCHPCSCNSCITYSQFRLSIMLICILYLKNFLPKNSTCYLPIHLSTLFLPHCMYTSMRGKLCLHTLFYILYFLLKYFIVNSVFTIFPSCTGLFLMIPRLLLVFSSWNLDVHLF